MFCVGTVSVKRITRIFAECDSIVIFNMPSVASIIGYKKTIEMFRNPENYDMFERKKRRSVNDYFDELYYGRQE